MNIIIISLLCESQNRKWVNEMFQKGNEKSEFATLFPDLIHHEDQFCQYFRMTYEKFQEPLSCLYYL